MITIEKALEIIYECIDELNEQKISVQPLIKKNNEIFFGRNGKLDSLGLVNLIVAVEEKIEDKTGISVVLADERAMDQQQNPFGTVQSLGEYIVMLLNENSDD